MELTQLRYFQTAAEECNFSRAADKLNITQPALSKAISNLERELGLHLFNRDGNRLFLSSCGEVFLESVNNAVLELETGTRNARISAGLEAGRVSVAMSESIQISQITSSFLTEYPSVHYREMRVPAGQIEDILLTGGADIALSYEPVRNDKILCLPIYRDKLSVLLPEGHPLLSRKRIRPEDLAEERILQGDGLGDVDFARIFAGHNIRINLAYEGLDSVMVSKLVAQRHGIAFAPMSANMIVLQNPVDKEIPKLCFAELEEEVWQKNINLIYLKKNYFSHAASELIQRIKDFYNALPPCC